MFPSKLPPLPPPHFSLTSVKALLSEPRQRPEIAFFPLLARFTSGGGGGRGGDCHGSVLVYDSNPADTWDTVQTALGKYVTTM